MGSAWVLVKELFGWRRFRNRREVAGCLGLAPSPYASGESQTEQGISKAGNRRSHALMVELAWCWLRYQSERKKNNVIRPSLIHSRSERPRVIRASSWQETPCPR